MRAVVVAVLALSATASAAPPRPGANHHLGDDSWIAAYGRPPDAGDREADRMHVHLAFIRDRLGHASPTRPELAARRAELLGYLDDYIAKATTPVNDALPWRSPVFIDERGTVCAVGYLIERSVGRAVSEQIAARHRYDFLEDIAADMPEVRAWIESSGLTLDELASIQPAYTEPPVDTWHAWTKRPKDGAYIKQLDGGAVTGTFKRGRMEGAWQITGDDQRVLARGTMHHGRGTWTALHDDGSVFATGPFVDNVANGSWKIYYPSGRLRAEGAFARGMRVGRWRFYYDTPAHTVMARGRFGPAGDVIGTWKQFDEAGALIAKARVETPGSWDPGDRDRQNGGEGFTLELPKLDGVTRTFHLGSDRRLERIAGAHAAIYAYYDSWDGELLFDADGELLRRDDKAGWQAADCHWSARKRRIAKTGDVARLHELIAFEADRRHRSHDGESASDIDPCDEPHAIDAARAAELDALVAARARIVPAPAAVIASISELPSDRPVTEDERREHTDLATILTAHMREYFAWPHIDSVFVDAITTMPGREIYDWFNYVAEPDDDGTN
ncbi:MAG TPA: hypothetical protein VFQ53_05690 [Kofleriaceae bacterium]|nr:hypothetical protein [Kofleriaceae bacterium]